MKLSSGSFLVVIISLSVITKLLYVLYFTDLNNINYFEYGELAQNLCNGDGFSMRHQTDWNENDSVFSEKIYKSAYMSPGYVFYLYPFFFIHNESLRSLLIILSQILISCLLLILLFRFTNKIFSQTTAFIAVIIAGFLPEFIYATTHIQVTLFYQLGIMAGLFFLYKLKENNVYNKSIIFIGVIFGLLILFRSEVILFVTIITIHLIKKKKFKEALTIVFIIILFLLPWQIRNYLTFNEVVPLTTSSGLNLYRGHNPYAVGVWGDSTVFNGLSNLRKEDNFEVLSNSFYLENAAKSFIENPAKELTYPFIKLFNLWILSPDDDRTYNLLYIVPWFILLPLFVYGLIKSGSWDIHGFTYLFLIFVCVLAVTFFVLPRYQTMMKVVLTPFAAYAVENLYMKIRK